MSSHTSVAEISFHNPVTEPRCHPCSGIRSSGIRSSQTLSCRLLSRLLTKKQTRVYVMAKATTPARVPSTKPAPASREKPGGTLLLVGISVGRRFGRGGGLYMAVGFMAVLWCSMIFLFLVSLFLTISLYSKISLSFFGDCSFLMFGTVDGGLWRCRAVLVVLGSEFHGESFSVSGTACLDQLWSSMICLLWVEVRRLHCYCSCVYDSETDYCYLREYLVLSRKTWSSSLYVEASFVVIASTQELRLVDRSVF